MTTWTRTVAVGFATFAMFFGAGNVVFPLLLGRETGDQAPFAMIGLLLTAVLVPLLGLMGTLLFDGDYKKFFGRMGKWPGLLVGWMILCIIGPFNGIPRCVALSYSTLNTSLPDLPLGLFSVVACAVIFLLALRRQKIVVIVGYILTPVLLVALLVIIVTGLLTHPPAQEVGYSASSALSHGCVEGYNTLDLLAAFFFSGVVLGALRKSDGEGVGLRRLLAPCLLGGGLLALVYAGLCLVSSFYGAELAHVSPDQLLPMITFHLLGGYAGLVANIAIILTCLTTALTLSSIFARFLSDELFRGRVSYPISLGCTMAITVAISYLRFTGIVQLLGPVVSACYPALIVLTLLNIVHKVGRFKMVRTPVYATLTVTLGGYAMNVLA